MKVLHVLSLFNKLQQANNQVRNGKWDREGNRGLELEGKVVGIIGYGHMGKSFAKKLKGFDVEEVICYDIQGGVEDDNARQKTSFENMFADQDLPSAFQYLVKADNVILSPHVAGWTVESKEKLAQTIVDKIKAEFC